jgi:hypothetical protein
MHRTSAATRVPITPFVTRCLSRHDKSGNVLAGVLFSDYNGSSVQTHIAAFSPNWASPAYLYCMFDYPFHTLGCKKLIAVMEKNNAKALQLNSRMGFKFEAEIEDVFSSGPAVIRSLRVEDCRFLDERFRCAFERYLETLKAAA